MAGRKRYYTWYGPCCICGKCNDSKGNSPEDYSESGHGKFKKTIWFHKECYVKEQEKYRKERIE